MAGRDMRWLAAFASLPLALVALLSVEAHAQPSTTPSPDGTVPGLTWGGAGPVRMHGRPITALRFAELTGDVANARRLRRRPSRWLQTVGAAGFVTAAAAGGGLAVVGLLGDSFCQPTLVNGCYNTFAQSTIDTLSPLGGGALVVGVVGSAGGLAVAGLERARGRRHLLRWYTPADIHRHAADPDAPTPEPSGRVGLQGTHLVGSF